MKNNLKNEGDSAGSSNTGDHHHRDTGYDHILIAPLHVSVIMTVLSTAAGFLSKHPQSQTVAEGSTANFTCELKGCVKCPVHWTAVDTQTGLHVSVYPQVVTRLTSTISILAVNNTVVQCEEYNRFATPKRERRHYSKVALLRVIEEQGRYIAI